MSDPEEDHAGNVLDRRDVEHEALLSMPTHEVRRFPSQRGFTVRLDFGADGQGERRRHRAIQTTRRVTMRSVRSNTMMVAAPAGDVAHRPPEPDAAGVEQCGNGGKRTQPSHPG